MLLLASLLITVLAVPLLLSFLLLRVVMLLLSCFLLLVACISAVACLYVAFLCFGNPAVPFVPDVLTVAGLPAIAGVPGLLTFLAGSFIPAFAFVHAVSGVPALAVVIWFCFHACSLLAFKPFLSCQLLLASLLLLKSMLFLVFSQWAVLGLPASIVCWHS
jgi:hypothetical protein